jgi:hypothetical protein
MSREDDDDYYLNDHPDDGDVCHHGVGFDVDCWRCDREIANKLLDRIQPGG